MKRAFEAHKWPSVKHLMNDMQFRGFFSVSLIFEFLRDTKDLENFKWLVSHKIINREKRCSPWPLVLF